MKKYLSWKLIAVLIVTLFLAFFSLPESTQTKLLPFAPESITRQSVRLGLDLQGGSQLDYRIDLRRVPEERHDEIIEGVLEVIQRRVDRLGVAEPNIFRATVAGEEHIIVELAETANITQTDINKYLGPEKTLADLTDDELRHVSLEKAKESVGKTIQLEFKEEKPEINEDEKEEIQVLANKALEKIKAGEDFSIIGQQENQAFPGKVKYEKSNYTFISDLDTSIKKVITNLQIGETYNEITEISGSFVIDETGEAIQETGIALVKLTDKKEELKTEKEVYVSHILISWKGLDSSDANITRTEKEAEKLAKEIKQNLQEEEGNFAELAKEFSDDKSNAEDEGILFEPVTGDGMYVEEFEKAALALEKEAVSNIVETQFGYHIIKANDIKEDIKEMQYQYEIIKYSTLPDPWEETGLTGEHFVNATVEIDNFFQPYISIQFNSDGAQLFEEITEKNIGKRLAIFVGGNLISAPTVNEKIPGGTAQITGQFTQEEAQKLARDLNTGAIPAPIILTGEYTIGATIGQQALNTSLQAGVIGIILLLIFLIAYYKIPGLVASGALIIYGLLLFFLLKAELPLGVAVLISLIIFSYLVWKIINNRDSGLEKFLALLFALFGFVFIAFLLQTSVILTLAGIAGIILSIGIAVDANILIFERIKEELKEGRSLDSSINKGFQKAWSAIRDSNFSTLIICMILFYFTDHTIKGFAFNLAAGIVVSMFTAIIITRLLITAFINKKISSNLKYLGVSGKKTKEFNFIKRTKTWFSLSGIMIGISILFMLIFGFNLGIDFKGGSLMEFEFKTPIEREEIANAFEEVEKELQDFNSSSDQEIFGPTSENTEENTTNEVTEEPNLKTENKEHTISRATEEGGTLDLTGMQILASGENSYIIKTQYLQSDIHDIVLKKLKDKLPEFTENRFTTIGPTIGSNLLKKALTAIVLALILIIVYVAFAFRKIPKEISVWRFGVSAIVALIHDIIIITGIFVLLGWIFNVEINSMFITAMLTILGYSVNDTIVVLDRLRENMIYGEESTLEKTANKSLNQTLTRSINTSVSTLLTLIAVLIFGSPVLFYFILALTLGIVLGTYSSIFLATPLLVFWKKKD